MKLLEVANVNPPAGQRAPSDGRWLQGYNISSRQCAAHVELQDPCSGAGNTKIIGDVNSRKSNYRVQPFPVRAYLRQSTKCEQPDDKDWFTQAFIAKMEYVMGLALVTQVDPLAVTWIGDAGVQTVALAGITAAQYRTAVAAGYDKWQTSVLDPIGTPIMHVPPVIAPDLVGAGILMPTGPNEQSSIYGTPVVINPAYDVNPKIFFTGEVVLRMTGVDDEGGPLYTPRINNYTLAENQIAAVDVAPCSIVRVG